MNSGILAAFASAVLAGSTLAEWRVAPFEAEITIPVGHACMGGGIAKARKIVDPLFAKGFVLSDENGNEDPVVILALDWCQCNNDSYDRWRDVLASAANTTRERIMLATVHQHDAPICDLTAEKLLTAHGMKGAHCDPVFHEQAVQRTAEALKKARPSARRVTHLRHGQAKIDRLASNRRIVSPDGTISWNRGSASGNLFDAPDGEIDPWLKTLILCDGDQPLVVWSSYAVHPMSHYGRGEVSADFPGLARARRQRDTPDALQIYFTGCAGDTTAGKYNDGDPANRPVLADRLYQGMRDAWKRTEVLPIGRVTFRSAALHLPVRTDGDFAPERMQTLLADPGTKTWDRIRAAMGLSWRQRVAAGQPIDVPCLSLAQGRVQFLVMPAETFVGYQLIAQELRPESFVMVAGFGDGAPGYIPTDRCWAEGYADDYCWVARNTQALMTRAMASALGASPPEP